MTVPSPLGFPAVFYQQSSISGNTLRLYLLSVGYTDGYSWDYGKSKDDDGHDAISNTLLAIILSFGSVFIFLSILGIYWIYKSSSRGAGGSSSGGEGQRQDQQIYTPLNSEDPGMSMKYPSHTSPTMENLSSNVDSYS